MLSKIFATLNWLPSYLYREAGRTLTGRRVAPAHVYLAICDHFEPYWNGADPATARCRIQCWLDRYPVLADRYRDSGGHRLKYGFFYPEEEYREQDLDALAGLCHAGYGEVEVHLHHDNDTSENLRATLLDYKKRLRERHGLLSLHPATGDTVYAFIHGNWSLCNSRPDRRWCGVNDEIKILKETGCYADLTMPSAPSDTQTRKVNSIYYAEDRPGRPKSHDWGCDARVGEAGRGLLMVQGPLVPSWRRPKFGFLPRIENGGIYGNCAPDAGRVADWLAAGVSVAGAPEHVFIKLYAHGAQEGVAQALFDGGFQRLFEALEQFAGEQGARLHYVSARQMYNVIAALEAGSPDPHLCRNQGIRLVCPGAVG